MVCLFVGETKVATGTSAGTGNARLTGRKRSRRGGSIPAVYGLLRDGEGSGDGEVDGVDGIVPGPVEVGTRVLDGVEIGGPVSCWLRFQDLRLRNKRWLGWKVCRRSLGVLESAEGVIRVLADGEAVVEAKSGEEQVRVIRRLVPSGSGLICVQEEFAGIDSLIYGIGDVHVGVARDGGRWLLSVEMETVRWMDAGQSWWVIEMEGKEQADRLAGGELSAAASGHPEFK